MNSDYLAALEKALAALDAQSESIDQAKAKVRGLIIEAKQQPGSQEEETHPKVTPISLFQRPRGNPFVADPNSMASRRLRAARDYMDRNSLDEAPFLDVYGSLPPELNGSSNARESFRSALQTSGKREGLEYEKRPTGPYIKRLRLQHAN